MGLDALTGADALISGGIALAAFVALFVAARWRWKAGDDGDAQADVGLD